VGLLVQLDLPDQQGHKDRRVRMVLMVLLDPQDHRVLLDQQDLRDPQDQRELQDLPVLLLDLAHQPLQRDL
jgi:hypothetical protein